MAPRSLLPPRMRSNLPLPISRSLSARAASPIGTAGSDLAEAGTELASASLAAAFAGTEFVAAGVPSVWLDVLGAGAAASTGSFDWAEAIGAYPVTARA